MQMQKRQRRGSEGFAHQVHVGLFRRAPPFVAIAGVATRDDIFPGGKPALRPWHDVVQVQVASWGTPAAVLALVAIANHDVESGKTNRSFGNAIIGGQEYDTRHTNDPPHHSNRIVVICRTQLGPGIERKRLVLGIHRFDDSRVEHRKCPFDGGDVDREKGSIQD